jgi:hypothetical protein
METPAGAELRFGGADSDFVLDDGQTVRSVNVPSVCHDFMALWDSHVQAQRLESSAVPDGWIESAGVYQMDPSQLINRSSTEMIRIVV